ncbi:methionine--tRNA ligase, mitochondrial-like [Varroa jacobsoni]|uniref:methionine--tRNA ligase, mitochondrial-like n=1 Tax=Varroa jacobsoni TaxID=62625 RepID=UPI000BF9B5CF|nr:methionine--tRNA ligase, mitochondrial-like [Varroa jacobsoni]
MSRFFVTTPIFYVNAAPHLGHCHTLVLADAINRLQKLRYPNKKTLFSTGTDEHGIKIQRAARTSGMPEIIFCNKISAKFRTLCDEIGTSHDHFIRTTDENHKACVASVWETLVQRGHIYKGQYEGWYSTSDENFVTDVKEIEQKGMKVTVSVESGNPVEWVKEENYIFRLGSFKDDLLHWLDTEPSLVQPSKFQRILRSYIEPGLQDLSVSRCRSRAHWGIPVPGDSSQTIYVWLDALTNYLTVAGKPLGRAYDPASSQVWPPSLHVIGKDILKFHGVYWPAFLMAAGLQLPQKILCHSHWTVEDKKMSKSRGNVICPLDLVPVVQPDGLRYFLLREAVPHSDANFSEVKIKRILNAELANSLGNLLNRCTSSTVNQNQMIPRFPETDLPLAKTPLQIIENALTLSDQVGSSFAEGNFYLGIDLIQKVLRDTNAFVQEAKPWELAKVSKKSLPARHQLNITLHTALEVLRIVGILLQPVIPRISQQLLDTLRVEGRNWTDASLRRQNDVPLGRKQTLYTRLK